MALAGESDWVRNVRAAAGQAVIRHGVAQRVELVEVPPAGRASILWAYLHRPGWSSPVREAQHYFGLHPNPTVEDFQPIVERYPVFRVTPGPAGAAANRRTSSRAGRPELTRRRVRGGSQPEEVAEGVFRLSVYAANVYFVRSGSGWALIDTAWAWGHCERIIQRAAEAMFEGNTPTAILLTHLHPDHDGAALELGRAWACPLYVHPDELPLARAVANADLAAIERYGNWLDRALVVPLMRVLPRPRPEASRVRPGLAEVAQALDPAAAVPGLPEWRCIPTPGHTPGHVAFFRERDRVLITGDAVLTVDVNSLGGWLAWALRRCSPHAFAPPRYTNWRQDWTDAALAVVAKLEPRVLAPGHGAPLVGEAATREMWALAKRAADIHAQSPVALAQALVETDRVQPVPTLTTNGVAVFARSEGPTVLLMPYGHAASVVGDPTMECLLDGLADLGRRVVTFDPPGSGRSARAPRLGMPEMVACAEEALVALGIVGPVDVFGHSQGGVAALAFTLKRPTRVRRLVLANTSSGGPAFLRAPGALWNPSHPDFWRFGLLALLHLCWPRRATETLMNNLVFRDSYVDRSRFTPRPIPFGDWFAPPRPRAGWGSRVAWRLDYSKRLGGVHVPTQCSMHLGRAACLRDS